MLQNQVSAVFDTYTRVLHQQILVLIYHSLKLVLKFNRNLIEAFFIFNLWFLVFRIQCMVP